MRYLKILLFSYHPWKIPFYLKYWRLGCIPTMWHFLIRLPVAADLWLPSWSRRHFPLWLINKGAFPHLSKACSSHGNQTLPSAEEGFNRKRQKSNKLIVFLTLFACHFYIFKCLYYQTMPNIGLQKSMKSKLYTFVGIRWFDSIIFIENHFDVIVCIGTVDMYILKQFDRLGSIWSSVLQIEWSYSQCTARTSL